MKKPRLSVYDVLRGIILEDETTKIKTIANKMNEKYHGEKDKVSSRKVSRIAKDLNLVVKSRKYGL